MIATVVDVGALWQTIWTAALAGLLVTVTCSISVLGVARSQEHSGALASRWFVVAVLGGLAMAAVVAYGIYLVVD
ncbi:MAG: hypothetical protein JWO90_2136 [Solirubrobacterales bacterium]|jgi:hypothetical protein|nr:hypothetical protein [Solirubrobacterales bacterium]